MYENHTWIAACDSRADGVGVYARGKLNDGAIIDVPDSNGSEDGCGRAKAPEGMIFIEEEAVAHNWLTSGWVLT